MIVVDDGRHLIPQLRDILDVFVNAVVAHVVGGWLGPQQAIVPNVLLGKAASVMTPDHRIGQVQIFDHGLQFALVFFGYFAAEDHGDFLGLPDGTIHIQEPLGELVHSGAAMEDEVVAVLHLREEQPVLAACRLTLPGGEEGSEGR